MSLFDANPPPPPSKLGFVIKLVLAVVAIALLGGFFATIAAPGPVHLLWYHSERNRVRSFMNALVAGDTEKAYKIWGALPSYSYKDFLEDWGPKGYYGPVGSYRFEDAERMKNGTGVLVTVEISPYKQFPTGDQEAEAETTKEIKLWVDPTQPSLGFAP